MKWGFMSQPPKLLGLVSELLCVKHYAWSTNNRNTIEFTRYTMLKCRMDKTQLPLYTRGIESRRSRL